MATARRKIVSLDWQETSGVDHPANEEEGWLVMKHNGRVVLTDDELQAVSALEEVLEEDDQLHKAHERLQAALQEAEPSLKDAPAAVKTAAETLGAFLTEVTKAQGDGEKPKPSRLEQAAMAILNILRLGKRRVEDAEEREERIIQELAPGLLAIASNQTLTKAQRLLAVGLVQQQVAAIAEEGD